MPLTAAQPGRQAIDVKITTQSGVEANGQGSVQVLQPNGAGVSVQQAPTARLFLDKDAEIRIEVTNLQTEGLKNVAVLDTLPEGVEFIAASDRGLYRADTRTAHWLLDYLAAGQTQTLTLRVQAKALGHFDNAVSARTEAQQEIASSAKLHVQAISDLALKVTERDNTIEVGKATVYEIKVTNNGSAPATGVQVRATFPDGMAPSQIRGPTLHRVDGSDVIFASLGNLQPQGEAVYYVTALAQAPGNHRFRAQVVSDQEATPIAREERTFAYRD